MQTTRAVIQDKTESGEQNTVEMSLFIAISFCCSAALSCVVLPSVTEGAFAHRLNQCCFCDVLFYILKSVKQCKVFLPSDFSGIGQSWRLGEDRRCSQ